MIKKGLIFYSYILMLLVIFILPFYSVEGYSILKNTTSHLGAQNTPNSWIMNWTFVFLGVSCIVDSVRYLKNNNTSKLLLIMFSSFLILGGIFKHMPIDVSINYNVFEDFLHSVFASATGFSFVLLTFSTLLTKQSKTIKIMSILMGMLATILSILIFQIPEYMGIFQRIIFITSFFWIIYYIHFNNCIEDKNWRQI